MMFSSTIANSGKPINEILLGANWSTFAETTKDSVNQRIASTGLEVRDLFVSGIINGEMGAEAASDNEISKYGGEAAPESERPISSRANPSSIDRG